MSLEVIGGGKQGSMPIGTVSEVEAQGMSPAKVATCSKRESGKIQGCPMETDCIFDQPEYGIFKFKGPRYIGYQLATGDTLPSGEPVVVENCMACHVFVRTMKDRMIEGEALRRRGQPGEFVRICAQEGDEIAQRMEFPVNIEDKVVRQDQRMYGLLKAQGIPVDEADKREAVNTKFIVVKMKVPRHPRPGDRGALTYANSIIDKIKAHDEKEREIRGQIHAAMPRIEATVGTEAPVMTAAEPVKRGNNPYGRAGKPKDEDNG